MQRFLQGSSCLSPDPCPSAAVPERRRRVWPEEEDAGDAWLRRGMWGRGKKEGSRWEETEGEVWQPGPVQQLSSVLCPGPVRSSTYNLLNKLWQPPFTSCFFLTVPCFHTSADWLQALFTVALHCSSLLYSTPHRLSRGSNIPWISSPVTGSSVHKPESSSSSNTLPPHPSLFRTEWHAIEASSRVCFVVSFYISFLVYFDRKM